MAYNKFQKLKDNVEAIETVLRLQKEGRVADEFERFLLSNYSGFGGLKFILNPASSVEDKKYWKHSDWSYFDKVRDLYGVIHSYTSNDNEERELIDSIKRSVNTAFYTPSYIIDGIVNALSEKNIKISTMLDPSAGIGKFGESFRKTFKDMKVTSFEKDLLTGRILKALYPQDDVHIDGFETIDRSMEGKFDIVTSNIPFGDISVFDPTFKDSKNSVRRSATKAIHNYFFLKALDQVRDGGLVIFITSRGVMDSPSNEDVRREMLNNAGLVTALRLPDGMFRDEAGTEVGSDLIVLQKDPIKKSLTADEEAFVSTMESRDGITINGYYDSHSDHILTTGGVIGTDPYGKPAYVYPWDDNIQNLSCALSEKLTNAIGQSMADVIYYGYINKEVPLSQEENPQTKSELRDSGQTQPVSSVNAAASRVEQPIVSSRPQTQSRSRGKGKQKSQGGPIQLDLFADWNEQEFQTPKAQEQEPEKPLVSMEPRSFDGNRKSFYRDGITVEDTSTKQLGVISSGCTVFTPVSFERDDANRMRLYILIRDTYNDLYNIEAETRSEQKELREELNRHYDNFLLKYGRLNERRNSRVVLMDTMGRDCLTLENAVGKGFEKADIFKRPVSFIAYEIDHVDTPEEALFASLNRYGVVNLEYMSDITGHSEEEVIDLLKGRIYYNPILDVNGNSQNVKPNHLYDTAEHFLSGNIYQKLDRMEAFYADMQENMPDNIFTQRVKESIEALRLALPQQIPFDDIGLQFGERWIPVKYYEDYIGKLFDTTMEIHYAEHIDEYSLKAENRYNLKIREEYCVRGEYKEYDGMALLAHAFHDTTPDIQKCVGYDFEGNDLKGPDMEKIQLAQSKIQEIRDGFTDYLTNLPKEDRDGLQNMYNRNFNCFVKARYDGSHQTFPGIDMKALSSPKFNVKDIYKSQKDCVWMLLQNGGGICDHEVGTGKTLIMCMAAHEMHRLGIANKPMIIALKANVAEIAATYMAAFPDDKILYASEKDYSPANRVQFFNRIKNNDYACVVMSHDQFNMIPQSMEIQHQILKDEIRDIDEALQVIRNEGGNVTGRMLSGLEKRKENLEVKMLNLQHDMQNKKDDFVDFGLMGIDHIFVDESHQFKNLTFTTRHQRVSGLGNPTGSQKALNLLYAIRTIQNRTGKDLGATFLSGTTISNSLTELYLLFKYLRPKAMAEQGIHSFDSWAAVYAKKTSDYEFSVTNAVVQKERFRYFLKVPELATFYNEITDYRTGEDVGLDRPAMNVILHNIQPTADQRDFNERLVSFAQSGDGELIFRAPLTDREQKGKMLIATDASRKAALDMRLISQELFSDDPDNKASHCARLVSEYYNKYNDHKGTQFIFSDLSTYKPGEWNVFQEIKDKLVNEYNIPEHEIRFIQEAKNQKQRNAIIEAMNRGDVRVLFGSTTTLGTGVNAQKRAVAVHHIDIPWRPSDLEQRDGRARRSGNEVAKLYADNNVDIIIYAVERTLDSYKFNLLQNKQLFITQLKTNSLGTRVIDEGAMDEENGMNFAEYVAILSGNDDLLQKAKLEKKILALESERKTYMQSRRETEYRLWDAQEKLSKNEVIIKNMTEDNERYLGLRKTAEDGTVLPGLVIPNVPEYISDGIYNIEGMGVVLQDAGRTIGNRAREMGTVYGFPLIVESVYDLDGKTGKQVFGGNKFWVQGHYRYEYNYGKMALSKENRLAAVRYGVNALENIPAYIRQYQTRNEKLRVDIAEYERIAGKAWNKEEDLKSLYKEMSELEKKIQASLEATNAAIPKPKEPEYKITKEGRSHYVKFPRNAYPLVSISEMSEFAKSDDWRFRGYVRGVGYEGGRFKTMVSLDEITVDFSLRQPAEQFIEKVVAVNEERENDSRWLIEHAQQEVSDIVDIKSETVYSARQLLEERGIDWHKPLFEEAVVVENPEEIKEEAQQEEKQDVKEADNTIQIYSVGQYGVGERGEVLRSIAHQIKEFGSESSIDLAVTNYLSIFNNIPSEERNRMVLIPMPGTTGYADYMVKVVAKLCEHNGLTSVDTLFSSQHASLYDLKKNGVGYEDLPKISFHLDSPLPSGTIAVILDNVLDTGKTLSQAFEADFGEGVEVRAAVLAHTDRYKEHNPDFMIKTSDDLKQDVKKRSEQKEMLFNAALERVRSERFGEMSVLEQNSVERLMKSSWYNPFGRSIAIAKLSRMGIDWESGGKFVTPVVNLHAAERATLSAKELSMIGQVVADLATGNHLLGRPRPEGYRDLLKDVGKAFEAVGKWGLSSRQSSLLKEMSKYYHDGYADLATVIGVEEKVLKSAVSNSDSHRQVLVNNPYNIIEEDGQIVVDYEYGFGFSDDFAMMLASEYGGAFTLNEEHRQVRFNDKRTAYNFIDAVQAETERIDRRLSTALDKKLSEAGIKVHLNSKEGQHVLNANFMQMSTGEIFISNARRAVEHIQQSKATPEQWLRMIEKNGGIKLSEDRWTGLSDWLRNSQERILTKQDILDYIRENQIQVEEVHYSENAGINGVPVELQATFYKYYTEEKELQYRTFVVERGEEYANNYFGQSNADRDMKFAEASYRRLVSEYGDDFADAFSWYHNPSEGFLLSIDDFDTAKRLVDIDELPIFSPRLRYTTDGLENRREIALTVPTIDPYIDYDNIHFGDADHGRAVAWIRFGESQSEHPVTGEKERVLVIDEVQSKRHQDGRIHGYITEVHAMRLSVLENRIHEAAEERDAYHQELREKYGQVRPENITIKEIRELNRQLELLITPEERDRYKQLDNRVKDRKTMLDIYRQAYHLDMLSVPDAPFEKNWHELAMKRMLRYAIDNGFDRIAWTTGTQQAERYNIAQAIEGVEVYRVYTHQEDDGKWSRTLKVDAKEDGYRYDFDIDKYGIISVPDYQGMSNLNGQHISKVFGEELSSKIMGASEGDYFDSEDLTLGGEGLRSFYDNILSSFINKYCKQWNESVEDVSVLGHSMHSVAIDDVMREDLRNSQPMFFRAGDREVYGFVHDGEIYIDDDIATAETRLHERAHLFAAVMREKNPEEWRNIVQMMKDTPEVWNYVCREYPHLRTDDEIADEALAQFSGRHGIKKLHEFANGFDDADTIFGKVSAALAKFWSFVADFFEVHYTSKEEVAERILFDTLQGVRLPEIQGKVADQYHFVGKKGAENLDAETGGLNIVMMNRAEQLEQSGKSPLEIKIETGWERSADGQWMMEIPGFKDFDAYGNIEWLHNHPHVSRYLDLVQKNNTVLFGTGEELSASEKSELDILKDLSDVKYYDPHITHKNIDYLKVEDFVDAPLLFAAYPALKNMPVRVEDMESRGSYIIRESIFTPYLDDYYHRFIRLNKDMVQKAQGFDVSSYRQMQSTLAHEIQHFIQDQEGFPLGLDRINLEGGTEEKMDRYRRSAGEVQARVVQSRMGLSMSERRQSLSMDYEDVPRGQQIFTYDTLISASRDLAGDISPENQFVLVPGIHYVEGENLDVSAKRVVAEERRLTPADREAGGALVDQLEKMGINVHTDLKEYRKVMKEAERDNSKEGNMRYFTSDNGKRYGFSYRGEMYLDLRKVDAELPLNQYARLWCQAMQKVNPDGWRNIVETLKNDQDSWLFAQHRYSDVAFDDSSFAEEIICNYSGKRGAEKLHDELQRMTSRDDSYSSRWNNIFQNIGKVIQDFWKHTGDSLNVEYKNVDDIADMILKDFATNVNPVKKMENWLKERDREYAEAVASGDTEKVQRMFNAALQEHVGNGITPYIAVDGYRGRMDRLARGVKSYLPTIKEKAINEAADRMVPLLSGYNADNAVLVPAPSHNGYATDMLSLANAISERTGIQVADVLKGEARQSQYELKKEIGRPLTAEELHIRKEGELPDGKLPIVVDNVVNSGNTAKACVDALGGGLVLSVASAVTQSRHVSTLKSAAPVVYDKDNNLVPLSERFTFKNRHMTPVQGMPLEQPLPYQEPDVIQGLEDFDIEDIRAYVENSVQEILDIELPFSDIYVKQVTIIGSRARGEGKEGSDLDILLEYGGSDVREDDLFNILNSEDNKISLDGIDFDINPINPKYSLSTAEWLARDARWREEDLEKNNNNQNNNVMDKNEQSQELLTKQQELLNYYTGLKSVYSKEVVLLRQKGFLEAFGKDAEIVSKKFDEPLLQRTIGEEKVPFVFFSNDKYLNMIDDTDVDLHIVSNPIHVEAMEEILPSVVGSVGVDNSVIAEELEEKEEALVGILGTRERYTFDNPPLLSVEDGIAKVYVDGYHLDEDNHVVLECERIDNAGGSETYTKGHGEYSVSDLNIVVNGLYGSKKFDIEGIARINENFKQAMSAIFARQEIEDSKNGINRIGEHEDTMNKINGMLDDILGVFSKHNDLVGDDNLVESDLTEQYERTHQLVKDLGLEYVPLTLRVPVVVNHLDEEILDDWRLEDDKAVLSHVMFSDIDEKVYVSRQNAYDDEKGVSLSELPEESQKQVLDLVEEMLNDQDRQLTVYVDTKKVPDWALNYVINGESDQLSDEDLNLVNDFLEKYPNHIFSHRDDEPSFDSSPAFGLAADTVPVDIVRTSTPRELRKERIEKEIADLKSGVADVGSTINHLMEKDEHLCYALLERMYSEVKDYLGGINPDESSLWAGNARNQVAIMGSLMMSLSEQPEWLTWDELANYTHQVSEPAESQENNLDSGINVEEKAIGYSEPTKEQGVVEDSVESGLGESERLVSGLDTEIKVHDGAPESYRKMMEESEMAHERESVTEKQEESKGTESVEKSEKEEAKPKSRWDNLDYTKYVIPDGVTVSNAKVNRFPPKEGEKYAKFVISCDAVGKHFSKEMWGNDIKAFYEKDENGKRTNRVTLDQLVAKYFGKQFAESMSIGSVQEAEHVLAEQLEEKERASDNKEQKQQELSDKEKEAAQRKAAEDKQAQEEAAKKKSEEEKKNNKKEKVPAIVLQASLLMSAFASAEEHDGKWLNIEGKVAPDFLQKGQVVSPFNALMMALHSDVNGYKTNVYTTFNAARSNGYSVKGGESGLPFNWYNWDKYVNRFNANEIIGKEDYEKLPEQEKELFKILRSKEERSIFNIDQTTLPYAKTADYNSVLESQSAEQSKLKQSAGSREENTVQSPFEQVAFLKEKHPDALIFMRNKDFYEVYGKDAETCANVLGITVSYPDGEEPSQEKAMASFAYTNLDTYLPKLIRSGSRVAICDRLEDVKSVKRYGVADSIYSKCQDFVDTLSKENNVVIDPYRDTCYDVEKDVLYFNKKRLSPIGQEIQTAIGRYNDNCRACVGYTGGASRLNRLGSVKMLPEDAMKYEQLVQELASGVMMVREGFPASLSKDSMGLVSYWQRELTESPNLMESLERDVNNAVEVLDKLKKGETVDYSAIRGEKAFDAVRPKLYTIASELATLPNVNTKEVVIVKDERNKTAAVILPSGASLEVNNEIPGMNKNRFVVALRKSGFENVRFYNAGGALGLNQSNEFFADKTIEVARLKQYDIIKIQDIDITEELERTSKVDIEKVSMTRDDKGNALLFVKPTDGESFTVYPEPSDVKTFFQSIHTQDFDNIREALGQKYYGLVLRHPDLKCNVLMPDIDEGIDLSRITKVNITKDKYKENTTVIFATIDGEAQKPVELTNVQAQRFWLVNDQDMYKLAVAAQIWQEKLSVGQGQSEDGQSQFRDNREGQGIDSGSPTSEEVKGEDKAQDNKRGGGLHL